MLAENFLADETAPGLDPVSDVRSDGLPSEERLHDRLFIGLRRGVKGFVCRDWRRHHGTIFPTGVRSVNGRVARASHLNFKFGFFRYSAVDSSCQRKE
jgi:hypothetical protein